MLEIDCQEVWRHISDLVDGDLSADLRARMEAHFKACVHCKAIFDGANNLVQVVGDGRAFELSPELSKRLYAKFEAEVKK